MNRVLSSSTTGRGLRIGAMALATGALVFGGAVSAVAEPAFVDYGDGCVLYPTDKITTLDSLRTRCTAEQQDAIYAAADAGTAPSGPTRSWVLRPEIGSDLAPMVWTGRTYITGPDGGRLTNRLANGAEVWPADTSRAASITDGKPAWVANYTPSPTPQLYDELREVVPGVWLGYAWWRGAGTNMPLLSFALAN